MEQGKSHTHSHSEARDLARRPPLFGSVWLALFVMLREGINAPRDEAGQAEVSDDGSPSRRP
ncbi:MAG: hypothetical protein ACSLE2_05035 [Lysobacterales bacterium]